jgi:enamine deaminase RidA (YjgF/YER057c/UK114 family)
MRFALLPLVLLLGACVTAPASRTHIVPAGWESSYDEYHYSPAVRVGDTVFVSGIPAAGKGDYESKIRFMFEALKKTLAASGAELADVVEINTFHAQAGNSKEFQAEFEVFKKIHAEYFKEHYPAWTAVGTTALLSDSAPVEMRAVAIIGSGKNPVKAATYRK